MGIPDYLTCLLRNPGASQEATVRSGHETTDWFQTGKGVRQGCVLSPCLFTLYAEFSSVTSDSLRPHEPQHTRPPCPSPTPVHPNPCPLSQWRHPTISSSVIPFSSCLQSFPASGLFNGSAPHIGWPVYWTFSISPFNEYSGLISFRIDWFDLLAAQGTLKSLLQHHNSKASILCCLTFFMVQLSHPWLLEKPSYFKLMAMSIKRVFFF